MAVSVYKINKGINRPVVFKGLRAQYIGYLGAGLLVLLIVFAGLYILGVSSFLCLFIVLVLGAGLFLYVHRLSHRYGEHGLMKALAKRRVPRVVKNQSRTPFMNLGKHRAAERRL